jgi:hypothetical protein
MTALLALLLVTKQTLCFVTEGDEKKQVAVTCPVDGNKFSAVEVLFTNQWGGKDADGCPHAFKTTPLESAVWVCPSCGYAARPKEFERKLGEEDRRALAGGLKPGEAIKKGAKQADIPGHVKFDLLAQVAVLRKLGPVDVGRAWLNAAWSCRQQGAVYLDDFEEWETLRTSYGLNQTPMQLGTEGKGKDKRSRNRTDFELEAARRIEKDVEAKKHEGGANKILARYLAAYLYRRHGETFEAEKWLASLAPFKGENSVVDEAADRVRASIPREREYLKKALEVYVPAVEGGSLEKPVVPEVSYICGEIQRRLGDRPVASTWYQKAIDAGASDALKELATRQKALADK